MKFAHLYKLVKDIPGYAAGRMVRWHGGYQRFYFFKTSEWKHDKGAEGIYLDMEGTKFTVEQVQDIAWFEPTSEAVDFIPAFPVQADLENFIVLRPECRLVDDVDECRAINALLNDAAFQARLYEFYKAEYERFHQLNA